MIHITCECGKALHAPDEFAGRQTRCPQCKRPVTLPAAAVALELDPAPPPAAPAEAVAQPAEAAILPAVPLDFPPPGAMAAAQPMPAFGPPAAPGTSKQAIFSLVLGCISFCLPLVLSVPAIVLGFLGLSAINKSGGQMAGKGMAITGLVLGFVTLPLFVVYALFFYGVIVGVTTARDAATRISASNSLKQIGIALHIHHDQYLTFPTEAEGPRVEESRLSWRVQILPALGETTLYKRFRHHEPWDSPTNKALLSEMPLVYLDRRFQTEADRAKGLTYFRGFVGQDSVLGTPGGCALGIVMNAGGASNTIVVVEAGDPVPWTKPEDPSFNGDSPFGGPERVDFLVLYADGHVVTTKRNTDRKLIRARIRWNNTEILPPP
jgi:hypothetical protein